MFTEGANPKSIHIYTAQVSRCYLRMFDYPTVDPEGDPSLDIMHREIPILPVETLHHRFALAVMEEWPDVGVAPPAGQATQLPPAPNPSTTG